MEINRLNKLLSCCLINLQKGKAASLELNYRPYDIALITEPYLTKGLIRILNRKDSKTIYKKGGNARACIRTGPNVQAWAVPQFINDDLSTICIKIKNKPTYIAVAYMDILQDVASCGISGLFEYCNANRIPLVMGMDSNAHNPLWGSEDTNTRGELLEDMFDNHGITVLNTGSTPTFETIRAKSVIDITVMNDAAYDWLEVTNWRVDRRLSFSDHKYIEFNMMGYELEQPLIRNLNKCDWEMFRVLSEQTPDIPNTMDQADLDEAAEVLHKLILKVF